MRLAFISLIAFATIGVPATASENGEIAFEQNFAGKGWWALSIPNPANLEIELDAAAEDLSSTSATAASFAAIVAGDALLRFEGAASGQFATEVAASAMHLKVDSDPLVPAGGVGGSYRVRANTNASDVVLFFVYEADQAAISVTLSNVASTDVSVLSGGSTDVVSLRTTDMDGGVALRAPVLDIAAHTSAAIFTDRGLIGWFQPQTPDAVYVGACARPSGSSCFSPEAPVVFGEEPGLWQFDLTTRFDAGSPPQVQLLALPLDVL